MASRAGDCGLDLNDKTAAKLWLLAFAAKARAKKWTDNEDSKEIADNFISTCGVKALACVVNVLSPLKIEDLTFSEIQVKINSYLEPKKKLVVAERAQFYARKQMVGESVSQFVVALQEAAENCEFDKLKVATDPCQDMIKMGLIAGLRNVDFKIKVLEKFQSVELSIVEIVEMVQQLENVTEFISASTKAAASAETNEQEVNHVERRKTGLKPNKYVCFKCGKEGSNVLNATSLVISLQIAVKFSQMRCRKGRK